MSTQSLLKKILFTAIEGSSMHKKISTLLLAITLSSFTFGETNFSKEIDKSSREFLQKKIDHYTTEAPFINNNTFFKGAIFVGIVALIYGSLTHDKQMHDTGAAISAGGIICAAATGSANNDDHKRYVTLLEKIYTHENKA